MEIRAFVKMHGLGNDFVVIDARSEPLALTEAAARRLADRRLGVGCDQVVLIEPPGESPGPEANGADVALRFLNADGSEAGACGNGTRCAAALVMGESHRERLAIATRHGRLSAEAAPDGRVTVDMGPVETDWRAIPLARAMDTLHLDLALGPLADPVATALGNPHATFFVADAEAIDLESLGPRLERDPLFPERANIGVAHPAGPDTLRLRVWERGAGLTRACGSGACAAAVAAARRGLTGRDVAVIVDGGRLDIAWRDDGHVLMTGPVSTSFIGRFDLDALNAETSEAGSA